MDLESHERKEMTKRVGEFREMVRQAVSVGGSSVASLACLLNDIMSFN